MVYRFGKLPYCNGQETFSFIQFSLAPTTSIHRKLTLVKQTGFRYVTRGQRRLTRVNLRVEDVLVVSTECVSATLLRRWGMPTITRLAKCLRSMSRQTPLPAGWQCVE